LAMLVSSTSMNVAIVTAIAMIHGLTAPPRASFAGESVPVMTPPLHRATGRPW
jgi:hypothetical protein